VITRIESRHYRCLRANGQNIGPLQVLVGANGSGKSVFLDVLRFLSSFMSEGLSKAIEYRTPNFYDLVWLREGTCFELAVEASPPMSRVPAPTSTTIRYEVGVKLDPRSNVVSVSKEQATLRSAEGSKIVIDRNEARVVFRAESPDNTLANYPDFKFGNVSALGNVDERFPSCVWLRELLQQRIQAIALEDRKLRAPSPPAQVAGKVLDGSNLAHLVFLVEMQSEIWNRWILHLRTALPDLESIRSVLRSEDNHRYLMLSFKNGVQVPSWVVSDGTLRLLALTILPYLPSFGEVYLIEEPETGVHPTALETIYQSLSSVYDGQIFMTSHSPVLLNLPKLEELLCFQKTDEGSRIIRGDEHPALRDWKRDVSMSDLFAAGVLG